MLRITTQKTPQALTLRLEGRLEGPWVAVLTRCWGRTRNTLAGRQLRVDLNGLTFVDAMGKARLSEMYAKGEQLLADDLETKAVVAEIQNGPGESRQQ